MPRWFIHLRNKTRTIRQYVRAHTELGAVLKAAEHVYEVGLASAEYTDAVKGKPKRVRINNGWCYEYFEIIAIQPTNNGKAGA